MLKLQLLLSSTFLIAICTSKNVFQGDCSSKKVLCEQLCITISPETYECSCYDEHVLQDDGLSCKVDTRVNYKSIASTTSSNRPATRLIPIKKLEKKPLSFKGNNYAEFPVNENTYLETNITIEFKLEEQKDGIILFAGQLIGDDFISITLDGPNIIMRHDCGEGTIEDMYHGTFGIGEWHEVNVWRQNCDQTQMRVDKGRKLIDNAEEFKNYKGITIDEGVFLGGAPNNIEYLSEKTGTSEGFRGCIRKLIINGEVLLNTKEHINQAYDSHTIFYCRESSKTSTDQIEMFDLTQRGIPQIKEPTTLKVVQVTSTQVPTTTQNENENIFGHPILVEIEQPTIKNETTNTIPSWKIAHFNGESKIQFEAHQSILDYVEVMIQFRPEQLDGVLYYWNSGQAYMSLLIENGIVKLSASLGDGNMFNLEADTLISLNHWHKVEVWRTGKGLLMKVDKQRWKELEMSGYLLDSNGNSGEVLIGSYGKAINSHLTTMTGFKGCIKRVHINGHVILLSNPSNSIGVTECKSDPCANFGCPGHCFAHNSEAVCACEWPKTGAKCGQRSDSDLSSMSFGGNSYLELDDESVMKHITGESLDLAINFKLHNFTSNARQILVSSVESDFEDYFELSIDQNKLARFVINLGSDPVVLTHPKKIEDERWTTVEVIRTKLEITLSVNGEDPIVGFAPAGQELLNVYRNVFVGNTPQLRVLRNAETTGLHGCIISLRFDQTTISHPKQGKSAINIEDCAI
ncbi:unnamed protein product [Caenorhabditis angaria]|uniref:Laminin G domain-containing protein n=1 Tax=Caenorhabditis angaria TaxID=860376 RepID=A0A9P1IDA4_9PELO|nr:unnamed protein product [Caenorhabditis angaria]